jgi:hypothetical protein
MKTGEFSEQKSILIICRDVVAVASQSYTATLERFICLLFIPKDGASIRGSSLFSVIRQSHLSRVSKCSFSSVYLHGSISI